MHIKSFLLFESKDKFPRVKNMKIDEFDVIIGKDADSNDYLSTKMAKEEDIWLHARGVPGSHVIIRVFDKIPTLDTIKKAAEITAINSKAKGNCKVVYCKAKFVKKSSDMKPGQVTLDENNVEEITVQI